MTVWDSMNLNAPATLRELAAEADTTPSGTTEPQDATSQQAGLSGECEGVAENSRNPFEAACTSPDMRPFNTSQYEAMVRGAKRSQTLDEAWAQRLSNLKPYATDEAIAHALRKDAGWMAWQEVQRLRAKLSEALAIVTAEKANWPHAGAMHDGARTACDRIIRQLEARGE